MMIVLIIVLSAYALHLLARDYAAGGLNAFGDACAVFCMVSVLVLGLMAITTHLDEPAPAQEQPGLVRHSQAVPRALINQH